MTDIEIADETLEQLFAAAAAVYEVPAGGIEGILAAAGETAVPKAARFRHPWLAAAGVLVIAAVGGAALWGGAGRGGQSSTSASSATVGSQSGNGTMRLAHGSSGGTATENKDAAAPPAGAVPAPAPTKGFRRLNAPAFTPQKDSPKSVTAGPADSAKIVHTGALGLVVPKGQVTPVLTKLSGLAQGFNGYVASSSTAESGTRPTGTVLLRIPADSYDTAVAQARTYGKVSTSTSSAMDVTASYTDLNAQINALKKTRDHYLTLLASAKTVPETLAVQQRIDNAQLQIDQLQGQVNVLANQASYGTLSVTVSQKAAVVVPPKPVKPQSGLSKAWHQAKDGFVSGIESLIAHSGRALVVLLVLLGGLAVIRAGWRIGRRRMV